MNNEYLKEHWLFQKDQDDKTKFLEALTFIATAQNKDYQNYADMTRVLQRHAREVLLETGDLEIG